MRELQEVYFLIVFQRTESKFFDYVLNLEQFNDELINQQYHSKRDYIIIISIMKRTPLFTPINRTKIRVGIYNVSYILLLSFGVLS